MKVRHKTVLILCCMEGDNRFSKGHSFVTQLNYAIFTPNLNENLFYYSCLERCQIFEKEIKILIKNRDFKYVDSMGSLDFVINKTIQ